MFFYDFTLNGSKGVRMLKHGRAANISLVKNPNDTSEGSPRDIKEVEELVCEKSPSVEIRLRQMPKFCFSKLIETALV